MIRRPYDIAFIYSLPTLYVLPLRTKIKYWDKNAMDSPYLRRRSTFPLTDPVSTNKAPPPVSGY